jgi:adenosylcobinamide-GDP ribazoletransferase
LPIGFLAALQFLTVFPPLVRRLFTPVELGRAVGWFPGIGLLLGCALAGVNWALGLWFPPAVTAALILALWVLLTGALHLDGFLDCCDAVFGGHTPEARLRIMRDEHVGAFAVIGGVLLLLLKCACLASMADSTSALIVAPTLGRWGMTMAIVVFPYARAEGLGRDMKNHAGWFQVIFSGVTATVVVWLGGQWQGMIALAVAFFVIGTVAWFVLRRLPGFTGDTYGALCEILETATLLVFVKPLAA